MAEWKYDRSCGVVTEEREIAGTIVGHFVATGVPPEHGPLIALTPRMEEFLRDMAGLPERVSWADAMAVYSCSRLHAGELIRELDAARDPAASAGEATVP